LPEEHVPQPGQSQSLQHSAHCPVAGQQILPSEHAVAVWAQRLLMQASVVQGLESLQSADVVHPMQPRSGSQ
jgi:hypothetical protein